MSRPVNRFRWRDRCSPILRRPRRDHYGGRHYRKNHQDKCEPIWFWCHLFPAWQTNRSRYGDFESRNGGRCMSYFTLCWYPKNAPIFRNRAVVAGAHYCSSVKSQPSPGLAAGAFSLLAVVGAAGSSGGLLPPSPPAEKATTRQDQAGKASTSDGTGDCPRASRRARTVRLRRALALLRLVKIFAVDRTKAKVNPPAPVPQITGADT